MGPLILAGLFCALTTVAAVVDRIAVTVGNRVITTSDIEIRLRLSAFQNSETPDLSLAARRTAAQRLIDQRLIEKEMELGHYPRLDAVERSRLVPAFIAESFKGSAVALDKALAEAKLTRQDLEEDLARQSELLTFLNLRFRPAVQVSDADVERFYHEQHDPQVSLEEARPAIEQRIAADRADQELEAWLADQRKRTRIVIVDKELR
jgi:hypothetical protein